MNFNSRNPEYRRPFGAVATGENIRFRFPFDSWVPVDRVFLVLRHGEESVWHEMNFVKNQDGANIFEVTVCPEAEGVYYYRFEMYNESGKWFYGHGGCGESLCGQNLPEWQLTVYNQSFKTPDFVKGGVIYHLFADRFYKSGTIKTKREYRLHAGWDEMPEVCRTDGKYLADDFFGGNFKGILDKLDYLQGLGVTAIYLSPIFEAFSNHRYDTGDYMKIDELLGSEQDFKNLLDGAEERGISIILDGVFNHSGADSVYFNKYGRYDSVGAYQSKSSPYHDWYFFKEFPDGYASWWGCKNVPALNKSNEGYRHLIFGRGGVIEKWTGMGVKGWRLDVVDELPIDFTYRLCDAIKRSNPNSLIIGEVWEDASTKVSYGELRPYLLGKQLDSVMNYPFRNAIFGYLFTGDGARFKEEVMTILENYPRPVIDCMMNVLGTHDTVRLITALSGVNGDGMSKKDKQTYRLSKEDYQTAVKRLKIAATLQFTLPGVPSVYYGDEVGLEGFEDPLNRRPFPWGNMDNEILAFYQALGKLRADNRKIFTGGTSFLSTEGLLIMKRFSDKDEILIAVNNTDEEISRSFDKDYIDILSNTIYKKGEPCALEAKTVKILK